MIPSWLNEKLANPPAEITREDIEREWQYRHDEAMGIGREPTRAWREADEWEAKVTAEEK